MNVHSRELWPTMAALILIALITELEGELKLSFISVQQNNSYVFGGYTNTIYTQYDS